MRWLLAAAMVLLGASGPAASDGSDWLDRRPAAAPEPRYVTFLRAPGPWGPITRAKPMGTQCPDDGCVNEWVPSSCTEHSFRSVLTTLRLNGTENAAMRPAVKILFNVINVTESVLLASVRQCLAMSARTNGPVFFGLDAQWWWYGSGLWNWYDEKLPGYDPTNTANVARHAWRSDATLKLSWHDWATIIRMEPAQNVFAPRVKAMTTARLQAVGRIVVAWWKALPPAQKDLLAGVLVGREAGIGYNAWWYGGQCESSNGLP